MKRKRYSPKNIAAVIAAVLHILSAELRAEIIKMKNGRIIEGRVVGQTAASIRVRIGTETRPIPKSQVSSIEYVRRTPEQKRLRAERIRRVREAARLKREQLEKEKLEKTEKERRLKELAEQETARKKAEANERASRAEVLRELVKKGQMEKPEDEPISYWDFAWRSLLVPGWGHFTIDRPVMGTIYIGTTVAVLAGVYQTRRIAMTAIRENKSQAEMNWLLTIQPELATFELRSAYAYNANVQAAVTVQKKVDAYHNSLYTLAVFYGFQVLHIIYNGIAWENGLLIVDREKIAPKPHSLQPMFGIMPELSADGRTGTTAVAGVRYVF